MTAYDKTQEQNNTSARLFLFVKIEWCFVNI